jgi:GNAT superfamily N-acetyltransferase
MTINSATKKSRAAATMSAARFTAEMAQAAAAPHDGHENRCSDQSRSAAHRGQVLFRVAFHAHPALRGHHIQMTVLAALLDHARAAGHRCVVVMIEPANRSSIRSRERSGFRRTGTMHFLHLGKKTWTLLHGERSP